MAQVHWRTGNILPIERQEVFMEKFVGSFQRVFGAVLVVVGVVAVLLPFIGEMPTSDTQILLLLGLFLMMMGVFALAITQLEVERRLLNTPIREEILLRLRGETRHLMGVTYVDRRTGARCAPLNESERVLRWVDLCNVGPWVIRAPHFSQRELGKIEMLGANYSVPPKE